MTVVTLPKRQGEVLSQRLLRELIGLSNTRAKIDREIQTRTIKMLQALEENAQVEDGIHVAEAVTEYEDGKIITRLVVK